MATYQTPNIGLNKWAETDYFKRVEINENFDKIDNEIGALNKKMDAISYTLIDCLNKDFPTGTILETTGFYSVGDGAGAKYIVEDLTGTETWTYIGNGVYLSNNAEIKAGSKKYRYIPDGDIIDVRHIGANPKGQLVKIKDVDPNIPLSAITSMNPSATLDNSYDWFIIQKAIIDYKTIKLVGTFYIDLPLHFKHWKGSGSGNNKTLFGESNTISKIINKGVGTSAIIIGENNNVSGSVYLSNISINNLEITGRREAGAMSGHGIEVRNCAYLKVDNCKINNHGGNGVFSGQYHNMWIASFSHCHIANNKENGVKIQHYYSAQKNNIAFHKCTVQGNGYNDLNESMYSKFTTTKQATTDYGHGFDISGTAIHIGGGTDSEGNSGAGIYLRGTTSESVLSGININGCYFEPNRLAYIYVDNTVQYLVNSNISGNYYADANETKMIYYDTPVYVVDETKNKDSFISVGLVQSSEIRSIKTSPTLFTRGEFYQNETIYKVSSGYYDKAYKDVLKLDSSATMFAPFKTDYIPYNPNIYYEIVLEGYTKKVQGSSFTISFSLAMLDYNKGHFWKTTVPANQLTGYATLTSSASVGDTVLNVDDVSGWNNVLSSSFMLNIYDYVLSNGYVVGTDFTTEASQLLVSNWINSIDETEKKIILKRPLTKNIPVGTKLSLGNSANGQSYHLALTFGTVTDGEESIIMRVNTAAVANDPAFSQIQKHVKYIVPFVLINTNNTQNYLLIKRIRVNEIGGRDVPITSVNRPVLYKSDIGYRIFDTTLNKPLWWDGSAFRTATGGKDFKFGIATINPGATSVTVTHGLSLTPINIIVTPQGNVGNVWVSNITSTNFTINCSIAPSSSTAVSWVAQA